MSQRVIYAVDHFASPRVLVACEFSGVVREAFRSRGIDAWSCDLLPTEVESPYHIQGDVRDHLHDGWEMEIGHPPCTYLTKAANAYVNRPGRAEKREEALEFFRALLNAPIERICIENPPGAPSTRIRKPDQVIHPWQHGHEESKMTCLWLKNLPQLVPTQIMRRRDRNLSPSGNNRIPKSPDRWKIRSRTYQGIANAMADQWGNLLL